MVSAALDAFGAIDILVNNVATAKGTDIVNTADGEWQEAFDQTLYPAIRMSRLVVPHMRQRGGGVIIMIASIWGRESGGRMVYNAVKAAEISLAKAMAQQLAKDNIRVNSVAPGSILFAGGSWDKRQKADPAGIAEFIRTELPFGRFGRAKKSAMPSRFWPHRARAGLAVPACRSTGASRARRSEIVDAEAPETRITSCCWFECGHLRSAIHPRSGHAVRATSGLNVAR